MPGRCFGGEDYYSEGAGSDSYEGSVEEFSARADGGFDLLHRVATKSARFEGESDAWYGAAVTAVTPAGEAGVTTNPEGTDDVGASAGARVGEVLGRCGRLYSRSDMYRR